MKDRRQKAGLRVRATVFAASFALTCCALNSPAATLVTSSVDAGGGRSVAGDTVNDGCIGGCGGVSSTDTAVARHGFSGQLVELASVALYGTPSTLDEGATSQLTGTAGLSDDSVTVLTGSDIIWGHCTYPLAAIDPAGLATASPVFSNISATVTGDYLGVSGTGMLRVLDVQTDNFGSYAGDGISDEWQAHYFGLDNGNALAAADPDGDEQNNLHEWTALTVPTDAESRFRLSIENVPGEQDQKLLVFSPRWAERSYTPLYRAELAGGGTWTPLTTIATFDFEDERFLTDTNATSNAKFYRIQIAIP